MSEYLLLLCSAIVSVIVNAMSRFKRRAEGPERILVVKLDHLGDVVLATPAIRALRAANPNAEIDALVSPGSAPVLRGNKNVNSIMTYDSPRFRRPTGTSGKADRPARPGDAATGHADAATGQPALRDLARRGYSTIVELRGDWTTLLLPFQTGARRRVDRGSVRIRDWLSRRVGRARRSPSLHEVETNLEVVRPLGEARPDLPQLEMPTSPEAAASMRRKLEALGLDFGAPIVCIHPGAAWRPRTWRADRFAAVADSIEAHYHAQVAILGSEAERGIEAAVRAASHGAKTFWLFGTLSIEEVAALFRASRLLIGNDAGLAHVAAAVGLPSVVLFGPQEPARFRPWSDRTVVLHHRVHCCPCRQTVCIHPENPCVNLIEVAEVEARVREVLGP